MVRKTCISVLLNCVVLCCAISDVPVIRDSSLSPNLGYFSLELFYHTARSNGLNNVISPFSVSQVFAAICEGAAGRTKQELSNLLRIPSKNQNDVRHNFEDINKRLKLYTSTGKLFKSNKIYLHFETSPLSDFRRNINKYYDTDMIVVNFIDSEMAAKTVNDDLAESTHGRITEIVDSSNFKEIGFLLTSSVYFKGQWTAPFNKSSTKREPFYDQNRRKIGEVNMMFNRYTYPFANIKALQARVIEIPYGIENQLSMLILLPYSNVLLEDMLTNFQKLSMDTFFEILSKSVEDYAGEEVDCYIPRFKISSEMNLVDVMIKLGIDELFDISKASLPFMTEFPMHISQAVHKAEIEVVEDGNTRAVEFSRLAGAVRFEANRPFVYMVKEKVTNTVILCGCYNQPSLY